MTESRKQETGYSCPCRAISDGTVAYDTKTLDQLVIRSGVAEGSFRSVVHPERDTSRTSKIDNLTRIYFSPHECLGVVSGDSCRGNALSTTAERPYLLPGVGMAVAVAVVGALDAARGARRANERANQVAVAGDGGPVQSDRPRLAMPAVLPGPDGVAVEILRLRF